MAVLVDGERVVSDSSRILEYLDRYALWRAWASIRTTRCSARKLRNGKLFLTSSSRRWMYYHFLPHRKAALTLSSQVPSHEKIFAPLFYPLLAAFLRPRLVVDSAEAAAALDRSRKLYALLADGRKYLVGERFSAADLTLASLSAPLLLPTAMGYVCPASTKCRPA